MRQTKRRGGVLAAAPPPAALSVVLPRGLSVHIRRQAAQCNLTPHAWVVRVLQAELADPLLGDGGHAGGDGDRAA